MKTLRGLRFAPRRLSGQRVVIIRPAIVGLIRLPDGVSLVGRRMQGGRAGFVQQVDKVRRLARVGWRLDGRAWRLHRPRPRHVVVRVSDLYDFGKISVWRAGGERRAGLLPTGRSGAESSATQAIGLLLPLQHRGGLSKPIHHTGRLLMLLLLLLLQLMPLLLHSAIPFLQFFHGACAALHPLSINAGHLPKHARNPLFQGTDPLHLAIGVLGQEVHRPRGRHHPDTKLPGPVGIHRRHSRQVQHAARRRLWTNVFRPREPKQVSVFQHKPSLPPRLDHLPLTLHPPAKVRLVPKHDARRRRVHVGRAFRIPAVGLFLVVLQNLRQLHAARRQCVENGPERVRAPEQDDHVVAARC
mmetsp:Transcript_1001/g.3026  ORF Transcript_1001/g.3026 Transcript_1001/m.3026 type:complete len:356 (-) Transcript_1001:3439-4506(-)